MVRAGEVGAGGMGKMMRPEDKGKGGGNLKGKIKRVAMAKSSVFAGFSFFWVFIALYVSWVCFAWPYFSLELFFHHCTR